MGLKSFAAAKSRIAATAPVTFEEMFVDPTMFDAAGFLLRTHASVHSDDALREGGNASKKMVLIATCMSSVALWVPLVCAHMRGAKALLVGNDLNDVALGSMLIEDIGVTTLRTVHGGPEDLPLEYKAKADVLIIEGYGSPDLAAKLVRTSLRDGGTLCVLGRAEGNDRAVVDEMNLINRDQLVDKWAVEIVSGKSPEELTMLSIFSRWSPRTFPLHIKKGEQLCLENVVDNFLAWYAEEVDWMLENHRAAIYQLAYSWALKRLMPKHTLSRVSAFYCEDTHDYGVVIRAYSGRRPKNYRVPYSTFITTPAEVHTLISAYARGYGNKESFQSTIQMLTGAELTESYTQRLLPIVGTNYEIITKSGTKEPIHGPTAFCERTPLQPLPHVTK